MGTFFIILGAFFLYKLVADFIIPIYRASRQVQAQFRNMQESRQAAQSEFTQPQEQKRQSSRSSDYIEFEEVRD